MKLKLTQTSSVGQIGKEYNMWYVEYKMADGTDQIHRWEGLTQEQSREIHGKYAGHQGNTVYVISGKMGSE